MTHTKTDPKGKPPLLMLQTVLFSSTLAVAAIGVPLWITFHGVHWGIWLGFFVLFCCCGLSITGGYHRLWSHSTYKAAWPLRLFYALFGGAALQNSILVWASGHRRHHRHVDHVDQDPYSAKRGLWFSHIGWMLRDYPSAEEDFTNVPDLMRDPIVMWQHNNYLAIVLVMNILPPVLIGFFMGDIIGGILVAGVLRIVVNHHVTFFINSLAHFWGRQPYTTENSARDNDLLALVTFGEGYHNYHHIFQTDYRNGVRWWQFDPTKWMIKSASWIGMAKDLKKVPNFKIQRAILAMQFQRAQEREAVTEEQFSVKAAVEQEYEAFKQSLSDWNDLRQQWYDEKRLALSESTEELSKKLDYRRAAVKTRFRELEFALKMQRKRMQVLLLALQPA